MIDVNAFGSGFGLVLLGLLLGIVINIIITAIRSGRRI